jgi:hypothetical protein
MKGLDEMRGFNAGRRIAFSVLIAATAAVSLPVYAPAAIVINRAAPLAITNGAIHVLASSALLKATIRPNGGETTYYFQYGLTTAYGLQTPSASVGSGTAKVKVGQAVSHLQTGATYHYRVIAVNSAGTREGHDRTFKTKGNKLKFVVPKPAPDVFGTPTILRGTLTGFGAASHRVALQASPYPFLESFTEVGLPGVTDALGRFAFRVANLSVNTQFRLVTLDPLPIYSSVVTVPLAVRVTFKVRSSGQLGLVRLYGTVSPAAPGARVYFQLLKPVRPGKNEATTRYVNQISTGVKRGGKTSSRFSLVVKVRKGGRYRAFVKVRQGPLSSGYSSTTILLHAAPGTTRKK